MNIDKDKTWWLFTKHAQQLRFAFQLLFAILVHPDITLQEARLSEYFRNKRVFNDYILPLSVVMAIFTFVGRFLTFDDVNIESVVLASLFAFMIMCVSYYLIEGFIRWFTNQAYNIYPHKWNIRAVTLAVMSVFFAVKYILAVFSELFFVQFFYLYTFYIVWVTTETIIQIPERAKNHYMVLVSLISFAIFSLIHLLPKIMVPNL